jgi:hypothetical protein
MRSVYITAKVRGGTLRYAEITAGLCVRCVKVEDRTIDITDTCSVFFTFDFLLLTFILKSCELAILP